MSVLQTPADWSANLATSGTDRSVKVCSRDGEAFVSTSVIAVFVILSSIEGNIIFFCPCYICINKLSIWRKVRQNHTLMPKKKGIKKESEGDPKTHIQFLSE